MEDNRGILPRKIKGFRDIEPYLNKLRWHIIDTASKIYQLYGFEHWDTPILEYADSLGKYMPDSDTIEQGVYSFRNPEIEPVLKSNGKEVRDKSDNVVMENHYLAMRYDLTAPLARMYAEKQWDKSQRGELTSSNAPLFKRFQYGPVFRYETKVDPGRYREFWQLDFDSVGATSVAADAEVCMILSDALEAIGLKRDSYIVKVNNRKILQGLLQMLGIDPQQKEQDILRIIDKFDKIGLDGVKDELGNGREDASGAMIEGLALDVKTIDSIISFLQKFLENNSRKKVLHQLENLLAESHTGIEGIQELKLIDTVLTNLKYGEERVIFDPTLVRGMAYYTGPVFEVESRQSYIDSKGKKRTVGAICGGGRYDGLVEKLNGIEVPATGASIGVDRLAELLLLTNQFESKVSGPVFIVVFDDSLLPEYQLIAKELRDNNIEVEIYYGSQKRLKKQLSYADKKNCTLALMLGEDEIKQGIVSVKDLALGRKTSDISDREEWRSKVQFEVKRHELVSFISNRLNK